MGSGTSGFTFTSAIARQDLARQYDVNKRDGGNGRGQLLRNGQWAAGAAGARRPWKREREGWDAAGSSGIPRVQRGELGLYSGDAAGQGVGAAPWRGGERGLAAPGCRWGRVRPARDAVPKGWSGVPRTFDPGVLRAGGSVRERLSAPSGQVKI